ncbi:transcriptional regulator, SarA/Rot family [Mammaliicoccus fleurettii]|uniref:transcriptional regulator, SarA/Rot family n=1 Tax=Mammaliicoccus fleurettii TaxID=150056 RepID=UPI003B97CA9B
MKTLVQLKYVSKKRNEKDERVVLVDIYKNVELEVNKIIEEVLAEYINNYGEQNLAMVK